MAQDPRFATAVYRAAVMAGVMMGVAYEAGSVATASDEGDKD
jgi:hypothetical protein